MSFRPCQQKFLKERKLTGSPAKQLGTLGGGNHFIEVNKDSEGILYLTVHSGSRNFGKQVAEFYQNHAQIYCKKMNINIPRDLEYLPMSEGGHEYITYLHLAQAYADLNRYLIISKILEFFGQQYDLCNAISSVHNYIDTTGIIRKGAISAILGEKLVIPLNMGKGIILGTGKGNSDYNNSAPHGAGRVHGRNELKRQLQSGILTMEKYHESMIGIFSTSINPGTIDESPAAYKTFDNIKKHLEETVTIQKILKPVYNIKAGGE